MTDTKAEAPQFTELNELASHSNGGRILFATDDFFAVAENMIADNEPVFVADRYTEFGKWMDGWETRRRHIAGHDWAIVRLGAAAIVRGLTVDTAHFTGNYPPRVSVQGIRLSARDEQRIPKRNPQMGTACTAAELQQITAEVGSHRWPELVPMTELRAGYAATRLHHIAVDDQQQQQQSRIVTHLRINIYPDGGIARLRVFGQVRPDFTRMPPERSLDLMAAQMGGRCVAYSNAHYGHPRNLLRPGRAECMADGWEMDRRPDRPAVLERDERTGLMRVTGGEWAVVRLGAPMERVERVEVETTNFKGNCPESVRVEVARVEVTRVAEGANTTWQTAQWRELLPAQKLRPHAEHVWAAGVGGCGELRNEVVEAPSGGWNVVRVTIAPDGGISRVRMWGRRAVVADE